MPSITQGSPLPSITTTSTKVDTAPQYYTDYLTDLAGAGETAIGKTAAEGIAAYDPLQTLGYSKVEDAAKAYQPGLTAAGQTAETAAGGLDAARISALLDPYRTNVVDEMARLQQQNIQRSVMPTLRGAFVGRGDLGSQRYAAATGQTMADMQRNLMGQQYGALSSGYKDALQAALQELQVQNAAAKTQADIAKAEQELGLTGAGALTKAGAEKQAYEQAKLDYPMKQATAAAQLMRGFQVPTTQTETKVGPGQAGQYGKSPLESIMGVLTGLGAIQTGSTKGENALSGLYNFLKNKLESEGVTIGGGAGYPGGGTTGMNPEDAWDYFFGPDMWQEGDVLAKGGLVGIKRR